MPLASVPLCFLPLTPSWAKPRLFTCLLHCIPSLWINLSCQGAVGTGDFCWADAPALCPCVIYISQFSGVLKALNGEEGGQGEKIQPTQPWAVACSCFRQPILAAALSLMCLGPADSGLQRIRKKINPLQKELDLLVYGTDVFPSKNTDFFLREKHWFRVSNCEILLWVMNTFLCKAGLLKNSFNPLGVQAGVRQSFPISSYFDQICSCLSFERPFLEMSSVT